MSSPYCEADGCHDTRTQVFTRTPGRVTVGYDGEGRRLCWIHGAQEYGVIAGDDWTDPTAPMPWWARGVRRVVRGRADWTVTTSHDYPRG